MFSGPAESFPRLVGDIGGTNARFGLISSPGESITQIRTLACADFPSPLEAIRHYLALCDNIVPRHAAIGIANPVSGDYLRMTNFAWEFSIRALQDSLSLDKLLFINDFTALALSLPGLSAAERRQVGPGAPIQNAAIGLIGPGTGLGVSGLIPSENGMIPLSGEGGHVSLAPQTDEELALTALLNKEYGHASAERILSGPGLITLYQNLAELRGEKATALDSASITQNALADSDPLCVASLHIFCALLGSTAGNLALTLGAQGGVYIGGGIVPRLGSWFDQSAFRSRFQAKGRFESYLANIPTYVITASTPALSGAAAALQASHVSSSRQSPPPIAG